MAFFESFQSDCDDVTIIFGRTTLWIRLNEVFNFPGRKLWWLQLLYSGVPKNDVQQSWCQRSFSWSPNAPTYSIASELTQPAPCVAEHFPVFPILSHFPTSSINDTHPPGPMPSRLDPNVFSIYDRPLLFQTLPYQSIPYTQRVVETQARSTTTMAII